MTALKESGFDISVVAFRENESKEWNIVEIIRRLACFLKERWQEVPPTSMYKSGNKALGLYVNESSCVEFRRLYSVIKEVVTLPEYIQHKEASPKTRSWEMCVESKYSKS